MLPQTLAYSVAAEDALLRHARAGLLRFMTCGSVDDGKSTLVGRLLYESRLLFDDQLAELATDSLRYGTQGGHLDLALLVDGLAAERQQGITIDVAYRFFATEKRKFIVADTPGHEQYTRNMFTGASTADLAIVLVDARKGLLVQTRRHTNLLAKLGVRHIVLAVNKIDLVDYSQARFERIAGEYRTFAGRLGVEDVTCIPLSALNGDNVIERSPRTGWYDGPSLMTHLETVDVDSRVASGPLRMLVQWVNRPDSGFRGYSGRVVGGSLSKGDRIQVLPSGTQSTIASIVTPDGELDAALAGQSITITLADEIDVSRGDLLCDPATPAAVADHFEADVVWMHEEPMLPGRSYLVKVGATMVGATITALKYRLDENSLEHLAAKTLQLNELGVCTIKLDRPIGFDPYSDNRDTGGFIVIDRMTNHTVGAGMLRLALRRSQNLHWQNLDIDRTARSALKSQRSAVVWLTGISGAGKSTIANVLEKKLYALGRHTYVLDGDNIRLGVNRDLGFTTADRVENVRRVAEIAKLMVDAGLIVIVALISPFRSERRTARSLVEPHEFCEVFVDAPLEVAEARDPKGLYGKARRGELANFTGIDSGYERPEHCEVIVDTTMASPTAAADSIIEALRRMGRI